jgi:hypothetical protein
MEKDSVTSFSLSGQTDYQSSQSDSLWLVWPVRRKEEYAVNELYRSWHIVHCIAANFIGQDLYAHSFSFISFSFVGPQCGA